MAYDPNNVAAFDPKDKQDWQGFKNLSAQATQGINNMPYVLGNQAIMGGPNGAADPQSIWDMIYNKNLSLGKSDNSTPLLSLLGLVRGASGGGFNGVIGAGTNPNTLPGGG